MKIERALISVWDKEGVADLAVELDGMGVEIISTGGTAAAIRDAGAGVTLVEEITGFPEILNGRVKTLHPLIHGGLLADRGDEAHLEEIDRHGIRTIDLVVGNLYPFREVVEKGAERREAVEHIDIGGPTMLRAAAKNHEHVAVVIDPADYDTILGEMRSSGTLSFKTRVRLAEKVFVRTSEYDRAIARYLGSL